MGHELSEFMGVGTVLMTRIVHIDAMPPNVAPEDVIALLNAYLKHVCDSIQNHSGIVLQIAGDDVLAFWHPSNSNSDHAQLAFDASRAILDSLPKPPKSMAHFNYLVHIALGTGQMGGDYFGPIKQFQIVGQAVSIASRILKAKKLRRSVARMSQHTVDLIKTSDLLRKAGRIGGGDLEPLRLFAYCPANS
jgi:class 3 adenylate cyclase